LGSKPLTLGKQATANTFPADCHSPTGCRLDISLLSTTQQGAERRSARKVTVATPCVEPNKQIFVELFGTFEIIAYLSPW